MKGLGSSQAPNGPRETEWYDHRACQYEMSMNPFDKISVEEALRLIAKQEDHPELDYGTADGSKVAQTIRTFHCEVNFASPTAAQ